MKQKLVNVAKVLRMVQNCSEEAVIEATTPRDSHQRKETTEILVCSIPVSLPLLLDMVLVSEAMQFEGSASGNIHSSVARLERVMF